MKMKQLTLLIAVALTTVSASARTLIAYYSYTNNVHAIATELQKQTGADIVRIQPAEKGLDYAADNYAIGSAQIAAIRDNPDDAASYPAIDPVDIDLSQYSTIIIGAPLWWSNMAAPLQSFLFQYGREMAGKNIGLIVSSASSGISGVEADAHRLIPDGHFLSPSLWIRSSQTSSAAGMISAWLRQIDLNAGVVAVISPDRQDKNVYDLKGKHIPVTDNGLTSLTPGLYIINGKKTLIGE